MEKKSLKKEKNMTKNYFILFFIILLTVLLVWYICKWYQVYSDYQKETPVIRGTLNYEITGLELDHYIMENPSCVIYMCTSSSDSCRAFEKDFKKLIVKKNLQNNIIYLNLSDVDINTFVTNFNDSYHYKIKLTENYPAIVEFTDGKVTGLLEGTTDNRLTITKVDQFIDLHQIGLEEES